MEAYLEEVIVISHLDEKEFSSLYGKILYSYFGKNTSTFPHYIGDYHLIKPKKGVLGWKIHRRETNESIGHTDILCFQNKIIRFWVYDKGIWPQVHPLVDAIKSKMIMGGLKLISDPIGPAQTNCDRQPIDLKPWEKIPDHYWDRTAVEMWCKGNTNQEIATRVKVHPRTVTNRIIELRRLYPKAEIPTNEQRRKLMIRDDTG